MTALDWILIALIILLLAMLMLIFVAIHKFGKTLEKLNFDNTTNIGIPL